MKIAYLAASKIPSQTANSIQVMKMCQAFSQVGHSVHLFTPKILSRRGPKQLKQAETANYYGVKNIFNITWLPVPNLPAKPVYLVPLIIFSLLKYKPDIVYGRFLLGCLVAAYLGWPTMFEAHAPVWEINQFEWFFYKLLLRSKNFKGCVVISGKLKKIYQEKRPQTESKLFVAHDACDLPDEQVAKPFNVDIEQPQVGYVGSLTPGKGVETILALAKKTPDINYIVAGGSQAQVTKLSEGAPPNLSFIGHVEQAKIKEVYKQFDIALLPNKPYMPSYNSDISIGEYNSPLKLFEYMAYQKAIISSDLPVLREVLNESNSILVPCDALDAWEEAVHKLRDPEKRLALSQNAYNDFRSKYTWHSRARYIINLYEN